MKRFRLVLLALGVAVITFAFTPFSTSEKGPTATVYAFSLSGTFLGSAPDIATVKNSLCPGSDVIACAQVWSSKTIDNHPDGIFLATIKKPAP
jgi:hypothetical protein